MPSLAEVFTGDDFSVLDYVRDLIVAAHAEDELISTWTAGRVFASEIPSPIPNRGFPQVSWALDRSGENRKVSGCSHLLPVYRQFVCWESPMRALEAGKASIASYFTRSEQAIQRLVQPVREAGSLAIYKVVDFTSDQYAGVELDTGSIVLIASSAVTLEIRINTTTRQRI